MKDVGPMRRRVNPIYSNINKSRGGEEIVQIYCPSWFESWILNFEQLEQLAEALRLGFGASLIHPERLHIWFTPLEVPSRL